MLSASYYSIGAPLYLLAVFAVVATELTSAVFPTSVELSFAISLMWFAAFLCSWNLHLSSALCAALVLGLFIFPWNFSLHGGQAGPWFSASIFMVSASIITRIKNFLQTGRAKHLKDRALGYSENQYHSFFESSGVGMVIVAWPSGEFVQVNKKFCQMTGYRRDELLNHSTSDLVLPDEWLISKKAKEKLLSGAIKEYDDERPCLRKDGSELWVQVTVKLMDGVDVGRSYCAIIQDLTKRKQSEEALHISEARFRYFYESNMIAIGFAGRDGAITDANDALLQMVGRTREELQAGKIDWREHTVPEYLPLDERAYRESLEKGACTPYEKKLIHRNGSHIPVLVGGSVLTKGALFESVFFALDLRSHKSLEAEKHLTEQLRELDRRKNEFLAMLSHELRNPLAPIKNALEVMRMRPNADPLIHSSRNLISRQVDVMVRLVDDLLDIARVSSGKIQIKKELITIEQIINQAVETARPLLEKNQHQLKISLPPKPVSLEGDLVRLAQAVTNLLNNAAKYMDPGGTIELSAETQNDQVSIKVKDTGIGMEKSFIPHVFELFLQGDRSLDRTQGGLGIGLTLVKNIVNMHGGTVQAFSDGPGTGSLFVIELPVVETSLVELRAEVAGSQNSGNKQSKILIVDDAPDSAEILALALTLWGYEVHTARDGFQALLEAKTVRPDVILLDIGLPGKDGYAVAAELRREKELQGMRIIAVTGYGQPEDRSKSSEAGFDYHLVKPVDFDQLRACLPAQRSE